MVSHSSLSLLQLVYVYTSSASAYFTIIDSFIGIKSIIIINVVEMVTGRDIFLKPVFKIKIEPILRQADIWQLKH